MADEAAAAPSLWMLAVVAAGAVAMALFGVRFYRRQKGGALGGAMSRPKAYWLSFAIWFWFILCPAVGFDGALSPPLSRALVAFGVSMWLRGAVEMVMLYVTRNWVPPIGIAHDVLCFLLVGGVVGAGADQLRVEAGPLELWGLLLVASVLVSLVVEVHHAWSFYAAVRDTRARTTGDDGIWFADEQQEHFRQINRNTLVWNVILTAATAAFIARYAAAIVPSAVDP